MRKSYRMFRRWWPHYYKWVLHSIINVVIWSFGSSSKSFSIVVQFCQILCIHERLVQLASIFRNPFEVISVYVLVENGHFLGNFFYFVLKFLLFTLHNIHKLIFLFFKNVALFGNSFISFARRSIQPPLLVIVFVISELVLERLEDLIDLHAGRNLVLQLLNFIGYLLHEVLYAR